ncbi:hypothetical protein, partial [Burkholderia vietnamiensis]|uniref:hypothetical protein n=1 Tax=Burkholderia vietnamiensis TaxID=60552 RepID=UPI001ABA6078
RPALGRRRRARLLYRYQRFYVGIHPDGPDNFFVIGIKSGWRNSTKFVIRQPVISRRNIGLRIASRAIDGIDAEGLLLCKPAVPEAVEGGREACPRYDSNDGHRARFRSQSRLHVPLAAAPPIQANQSRMQPTCFG